MSRRIKSSPSGKRDYEKIFREYFGFHLSGLEVMEVGGQMQAQVIYNDFRHIDTVRRELAQMMPEVEFTKLRRDYSDSAALWSLGQMMCEDHPCPVIYVQRGDSLVRTSLRDIAVSDLRQLELDEEDENEIRYTDFERSMPDDSRLRDNALD